MKKLTQAECLIYFYYNLGIIKTGVAFSKTKFQTTQKDKINAIKYYTLLSKSKDQNKKLLLKKNKNAWRIIQRTL